MFYMNKILIFVQIIPDQKLWLTHILIDHNNSVTTTKPYRNLIGT